MKPFLFLVILFISYSAYNQEIDDISPNRYRFRYKSILYKGSRLQITSQIRTIKNSPKFSGIPEEIQVELNKLFIDAKKQAFPRIYKKKAILFLDALYNYEKFVIMYNGALYEVVEKLKRDMKRIDFKLERQYIKAKTAVDRLKKNDSTNIKEIRYLSEEQQKSLVRLASHRWMKKKFDGYKGINIVENPDDLITEFKKGEASYIFSLYGKKTVSDIKNYLENEIIDFYYNKAILEIDTEKLDLQYINKYN
ncbi:hypothetical protein SAMN04487910_3536 [Aquimarina amphilecti]|uniref:DUF4294 domain-containing protein n=1 Tax=Aquimarina amphilecti TaxID=1038014 RepID=A0A1H7TPP3_AQUAM|nr:hypothetical protein [Aquimarina amphilecti]SEL86663.1 hypothetical protein SAMN04487910_3536 [Aquimarina amphilecti]